MGKFRTRPWLLTLVTALAAAVALVAPLHPATSTAAPADPLSASTQVEQAVARIDTNIDYQNAYGIGTGIVIDPNGVVLTNFHVVQGADRIHATVAGASFEAQLVGYDRGHDIAVLQLQGASGLPTATLGDSATLAPGAPVVALGNANGSGSPLTRETGTVSAFDRTVNAEDELTGSSDQITGLIEIAAPVRAGDSGGPVINSSGQVVGITTAASVNFRMGPGGKGFAIPINQALAIAGQIRSQAPSDSVHVGPPTLLGVGVRTAEHSGPGVVVQDVLRGGPADGAGMHPGDVLIDIDGTRLDSATALTNILDRHYPGDVVNLTWIDRAGAQRDGKATLTAGP